MDNISEFNKTKVVDRPHSSELFDRILGLIDEYHGELSVAEVLGVLRLIDDHVININCRGGYDE